MLNHRRHSQVAIVALLSLAIVAGGIASAATDDERRGRLFRGELLALVEETRDLLGETPVAPNLLDELDRIEERIVEIPDAEYAAAEPFVSGHVRSLLQITARLRYTVGEHPHMEVKSFSPGLPSAEYPEVPWIFVITAATQLPTQGVLAGGFGGHCDETKAPSPSQRFTMLNEVIAAEALRDSAGHICAAIDNGEPACILTDIAFLLNRGFVDNQFLCADMVNEAEMTGTYLRLGHLHGDLEDADTNLTTRIDTLESNTLGLIEVNKNHILDIDQDLVNHDLNMVTRTDQIVATIEALSKFLKEFRAEDMRMEIEANLADSDNKPEGTFQFPDSFGGHLELVNAIVTETIDAIEAAGEDTGNARSLLARGEEYYASGDWKRAYDEFGRAYRAATR